MVGKVPCEGAAKVRAQRGRMSGRVRRAECEGAKRCAPSHIDTTALWLAAGKRRAQSALTMEWARRDELGRTRRLKPVQNFCVTTFGGYKFQSAAQAAAAHATAAQAMAAQATAAQVTAQAPTSAPAPRSSPRVAWASSGAAARSVTAARGAAASGAAIDAAGGTASGAATAAAGSAPAPAPAPVPTPAPVPAPVPVAPVPSHIPIGGGLDLMAAQEAARQKAAGTRRRVRRPVRRSALGRWPRAAGIRRRADRRSAHARRIAPHGRMRSACYRCY